MMQNHPDGSSTILMTSDAVGGVWTYALTLCAALPQYRFVLAIMGPAPNPAQRETALSFGNVVVEAREYRLEWMEDAAADLDASREWLAALARQYDAALLHCNGYAHAWNDSGCPTVAVAHSDVVSWWNAVHGEAAPAVWDAYRREVITGLAAADHVVAPTHAVLDDLERHYGFSGHHTTVIPNGIDLMAFAPCPKRDVVMAAGRLWDKAKNIAFLDDIAGELDWPIEIAGEHAHSGTDALCFRAVRPLGVLSPQEMVRHLGDAAIFAAPARYEPFGLGILEAAASGCALVLGDIASLRENWHGAAFFVSPDDRTEWRSVLAELIVDEARRRRLAMLVRLRAQAFSREAMARRYNAIYRDLIGHGTSRKVA